MGSLVKRWRYTIRYMDPHHTVSKEHDSFITSKTPRQWLTEADEGGNSEYVKNFNLHGDTYLTQYTDGTGRIWFVSISPYSE